MVERNQIGMLDGHAMDVVRWNLTLGRTRRFTKMPTEPRVYGEVCSPHEPAPLGRRVARIFHGEALFSARENRTKPLTKGLGVLVLLTRGPLTNIQVVCSLRDLAQVGPVVLSETLPRFIDGHDGARPIYYGRMLGEFI